jgi:hypothetical protein
VVAWRQWRREIWWFALPLALCPVVALLRPGDPATAMARAHALLDWERSVGIAVEPSVHAWVTARPLLGELVDGFYFTVHLSALIATALWLAVRRPEAYRRFRTAFAAAQTITACIYVLLPVAPLRMVIAGASGDGPAWTKWLQYEFAAVPSGHVVFALVVGIALWRDAPPRWRWSGIAYPVLTTFVVMATAHHLLVDTAVAAAVVVAVTAATAWARTHHPPDRTAPVATRPPGPLVDGRGRATDPLHVPR